MKVDQTSGKENLGRDPSKKNEIKIYKPFLWYKNVGVFFGYEKNHVVILKHPQHLLCFGVFRSNQKEPLETKPSDGNYRKLFKTQKKRHRQSRKKGKPQLSCEAATPKKRKTNCPNMEWMMRVSCILCNIRFFHVFHGFKVVHPKKSIISKV